jgi:hypothetical protein
MSSDGDDDEYDFVDIVDFGGERWAKNWYWQGQCCTESTWEPNSNGGTGMDWRAWITGRYDFYTEIYISYDIILDAVDGDFINSSGFKLPGVKSDDVETISTGRIMINDWDYGNLDPAYYNTAFWNGYTVAARSSSNKKTGHAWFVSGQRHNITIRAIYGTEGTLGSGGVKNGSTELFVDGIFILGQGVGSFRPGEGIYNIPFYPPDSNPTGWNTIAASTFMGGEGAEYQSPKDQYMLMGDIRVWRYKRTAVGVPFWDDANPRSGPLRDINSTLTKLGY